MTTDLMPAGRRSFRTWLGAGWPGMAALIRVAFLRSGRRGRLHLRRTAAALGLSLLLWGVLGSAIGQPSFWYTQQLREMTQFIVGLVVAYAAFVSLAAGAELAGPANQRALALTSLSQLTPARTVLAVWVGRLAVIVTRCLGVAPFLAALSLLGAIDVVMIPRGALAVLLLAAMIAALGLVVSPRAKTTGAGVSMLFSTILVLLAGLPMVAYLIGGDTAADHLLRWLAAASPFMLLDPDTPITRPVVSASIASVLLLVAASAHLRQRLRHFADAADAPAPTRAGTVKALQGASLAALGQRRNRRLRVVHGLAWLAVIGFVAAVTSRGSGTQLTGLLRDLSDSAGARMFLAAGLAYAAVLYAVAGTNQFWVRLESRGLLPLLLSGPLATGDYLRASFANALFFAKVPLLLAIPLYLSGVFLEHVPSAQWTVAAAATVAALALLMSATLLDGVGAAHGEAKRRLELLAMLCGGPLAMVTLLEVVGDFSHGFVRTFLWLVALILGLGLPIHFYRGRRRDPRNTRRVPIAVIGFSIPLVLTGLGANQVQVAALSPLVGVGASIHAAVNEYNDIHQGAAQLLVIAIQLAGAVVLGWWSHRHFDRITRRVGS